MKLFAASLAVILWGGETLAVHPKTPALVFTYKLESLSDSLTYYPDGEIVYDVRGANSSGDTASAGRYRAMASSAQKATASTIVAELLAFDDAHRERPLPSAIPLSHTVTVWAEGKSQSIDLSVPVDDSKGVVKGAGAFGAELVQTAKRRPVALVRLRALVDAAGASIVLGFEAVGKDSVSFNLKEDGVVLRGPSGFTWNAPPLRTGLVDRDARGLGGVGRPATMRPGNIASIVLESVPALSADTSLLTVVVEGSMKASGVNEFGDRFLLSAPLERSAPTQRGKVTHDEVSK